MRRPPVSLPPMSVEHYENFPVASWLCPPRIRPAVKAIYWFARTADDLADEGDAPAPVRQAHLQAYRAELDAAQRGKPTGAAPWAGVFGPLARAIEDFRLPPRLLHDLLDAFEQDVRQSRWPDRAALLDYASRSANPVGRLLLHLYGIGEPEALARSDRICTALQLANFWQDVSVDARKDRIYLPEDDRRQAGVRESDVLAGVDTPQSRELVRALCRWTRDLMLEGAPLARRVPGRAGWELRLVVQGGLRILDRIEAVGGATLGERPRLRRADALPMLWRALRM